MFGTVDGLVIIAIALFVIGFVLVGIEMIIPGLNAPGVIGAICLLAAIFMISDSIEKGIIVTIIVLAILGIMLATILGMLSKGKFHSPIILKDEQNKDKGYIGTSDLNYLLGKKGIAVSDLRPTGTGDFDGVELDVISQGKYISKGTKLVIFKVEGSKLIVKVDLL